MSSIAEAGIQKYIIEAVLDERTTNICRYLHGKVFSVGDSLKRFEKIESMSRPQDIKHEQPWVLEVQDVESGNTVMYVNKESGRVKIGQVQRSGFGNKDDVGEFSGMLGNQALSDLGLSMPPYHGLCRSYLISLVK